MIDNQRQQLGILCSIGYSKARIMLGYSAFGLMITIPSAILGVFGARYVIAGPLYSASIKYYTITENSPNFFTSSFWLAVFIVGFVTCGAAFLSGTKSISLMPATLFRPKPPARGRRILLERISFLWNNMNFSGKMISRNLFRSKARMVMGLLGVVGSTALIFGGLGVKDSMNNMIDTHYNKTLRYDAKITLTETTAAADIQSIISKLNAEYVERVMGFGVYVNQAGSRKLKPVIVLEDQNRSIGLTNQGGKTVSIPKDGVIITQRISELLDVQVGDMLPVQLMDGKDISFKVSDIVTMQLGQGIYMSRSAFDKLELAKYKSTDLLVHTKDLSFDSIKNSNFVKSIETKENQKSALDETMELMKSVQYMTILFAAILALAVMYVIGQLNFHERIRELATLKVLGFYHGEIKKLVLSENIIIAMAGAPLGILAGYGLLQGILSEATTADMSITMKVELITLLISILLTIIFTLIVNMIIGRKFKKVNMVESLKSIE